jgi:hypothetical protein
MASRLHPQHRATGVGCAPLFPFGRKKSSLGLIERLIMQSDPACNATPACSALALESSPSHDNGGFRRLSPSGHAASQHLGSIGQDG